MREFNKARSAGVTIEVLLSIVLAVGVLFVVLGIFGDNLKSMTAASGFNRLFNKTSTVTEYDSKNANYSDSQVNVEIVAEQGSAVQTREKYRLIAYQKLEELAAKGELTRAEKIDLAKWITIYCYGRAGAITPYLSNIFEGKTTYTEDRKVAEIAKTYNINWVNMYNGETGIGEGTEIVDWYQLFPGGNLIYGVGNTTSKDTDIIKIINKLNNNWSAAPIKE